MQKYLHFTKPDGSKVRILKGTVIEFDLWIGAANAEQSANGMSNELTAKSQIVIGDTWELRVGGHAPRSRLVTAESFFSGNRTRIDMMLYSICMTQLLKHCEDC
jgi:hypothetical protein